MQFHRKKISEHLENITTSLNQEFLTQKQLSKIVGQRSSMHLVIVTLVHLFTRNMKKNNSWYEQKIVNENVKEELNFCCNNISIYNGYRFNPKPLTSEGYGGFVVKHLNKKICSTKFGKYEEETSSTFRELLAVKDVLTSFGYILKIQSVNINNSNKSQYQ